MYYVSKVSTIFNCSNVFLQIEESNVQSWRKGCRQVDETKQKGLFMGCFTANFLQDFTRIKI